ncbi:unnamed protein product [Thlaspi arvense]|uniref:Peptidase C1A papain C-terminal domain-containing protein n=1 Tax=Thlaspi arvense TaxID=13288 RepID=A0AAU9RRN2_THLAR|nr:unnamed protein product [Thlaspi arvense]
MEGDGGSDTEKKSDFFMEGDVAGTTEANTRKRKSDSDIEATFHTFQGIHGAGGEKKNKKTKKSTSGKAIDVTSHVKLMEGDPNYPKDVPSGSKHYEKFWTKELREVMNQGTRRTCWTVASTRGLSARLLVEKKVGSLKHMSALHLLVGLFDKTDKKGGLRNLGHLKKFLEENGAVLEKDCKCVDPFSEMKKKRTDDKSKITKPILCTDKHGQPKCVFRVKELIVLEDVVEKDLIVMLNKGPVAISIINTLEFVAFKGSGVYEGRLMGGRSTDIDYHMLLCYGYGTTNTGVHYWKVQNSAGLSWGENGVGKIIREVSRGGRPSLIEYVIYPVLLDEYEDED